MTMKKQKSIITLTEEDELTILAVTQLVIAYRKETQI